jgi:ElaB/YqjD/DUF883 family membrane-anchored ribosome-binding protein
MNSVNQILESVGHGRQSTTEERPKFQATWGIFQTLTVVVPGFVERTIRLQINASNHHSRRFSFQFVNDTGRPCSVSTPIETTDGVRADTFDAVKALLDSAKEIVLAEAAKDAAKQAEFQSRRTNPGLKHAAPAIRSVGKTEKKKAKEAARKGGT